MFRKIFSILFLIFNISNSCCTNEDQLGRDNSSFQIAIFSEQIFQYRTMSCPWISCRAIATEYSEDCSLEWFNLLSSTEVLDCAWLGTFEACVYPLRNPFYQWVESSQLGIMGQKYNQCPGGQLISAGQSFYFLNQPTACHCTHFQYTWKINLGELRSRERDNYVIAGVRFRLRNQVLFLQHAEGKLEATGEISNISWVPLPDSPDHYHSITLESRTFFLDDLILPPGYAMTAIKFNGVDRGTENIISGWAMSISGVPFDDRTRKLDLTPGREKIARSSDSMVWSQLVYPRTNPIHSRAATETYPSPKEYNYVTLELSALTADFGQSTLPLFDNTPISFKYAPLAGAGIFHQGSVYHAGYISLRILPVQ